MSELIIGFNLPLSHTEVAARVIQAVERPDESNLDEAAFLAMAYPDQVDTVAANQARELLLAAQEDRVFLPEAKQASIWLVGDTLGKAVVDLEVEGHHLKYLSELSRLAVIHSQPRRAERIDRNSRNRVREALMDEIWGVDDPLVAARTKSVLKILKAPINHGRTKTPKRR